MSLASKTEFKSFYKGVPVADFSKDNNVINFAKDKSVDSFSKNTNLTDFNKNEIESFDLDKNQTSHNTNLALKQSTSLIPQIKNNTQISLNPNFYFSKKETFLDSELVVSYKNSFYDLIFPNFNAIDFNFFMALCFLLKEKQDSIIKVDYIAFLKIINKEFYNKKRFFKEFDDFCKKAIRVYFHSETSYKANNKDDIGAYFSAISYIKLHKKEGFFEISFNPQISNLLNNISTFYTSFALKEFCKLKSKYSKLFYLLLIRFVKKGSFSISRERFLEYFSLNNTNYEKEERNINIRIINSSLLELEKFANFKDILCTKIKEKGGVISAYNFTFSYKGK